MKTALNCSLSLCLAACLFAFPTPGLADDGSPANYQMEDGVPVAPAGPAAPGSPEVDGTYYLSLTGLDFFPIDSDMTYSELNGGMYALDIVPDYGFSASYHLPDGSTVTAITIYLMDNTATDIELDACGYNPATNSMMTLGSATTAGASAALQAIDLSLTGGSFTIANDAYAYRLRVEFTQAGTGQRVFGARIQYSLPTTPAATDYITLAGANLRSTSSNLTYAAIGGTVYATALELSFGFEKRLDLPQGAVIDQVEWFVIDNHAEYIYLAIFAHRLSDNSNTTSAAATTEGTAPSPDIQVFTDDPSITIDNTLHEYCISFLPTAASSNLRVVGARVRYTPPETTGFGPQVKSYSGAHFFPSGSALTYQAYGSGIYALALSGGRSFQTSMGLPSGARVDKVTYFFVDESAENILFIVRHYFPATATYSNLGAIYSSGSSAALRTVSLEALGPVDTATTVPRLRVESGEAGLGNLLVGAQVEYSFPTIFLPLINK